MTRRTFAIGDIHGDLSHLLTLMERLPELTEEDTLVFVGDYIDRGPDSAGVVRYLMALPDKTPAKVVCLRGNHEDGWLRALGGHWPQFILPSGNGCLQAMESFMGLPISEVGSPIPQEHFETLLRGEFFPDDVVTWMKELQWWYEDAFAIYVHAGLVEIDGEFTHPSKVPDDKKTAMLWTRSKRFFTEYEGKPVIFGHTKTHDLPPELSTFTPEDPDDIWAGPCAIGLDTACGKGGFLTAVELPAMLVYESR